ncbi:MAG: Holliday junction branch migration protein RuvA [Planctomycetota bacterium]|jgi:Holliday junction DNA helicase RuvA
MIDSLQGTLALKSPTALTIEVAGIGYRVQIPLSTYEALPREGRDVRLLAYLHVREDELSLYGFATALERELFTMLLGVSGVGPMMALRVLSSCSPAEFKRHVIEEDADALKAIVKGIGTKTARRLIAELQGAVKGLAVRAAEAPSARAVQDAVQALVALGESRAAAERAVKAALEKLGPETEPQRLVEEALAH